MAIKKKKRAKKSVHNRTAKKSLLKRAKPARKPVAKSTKKPVANKSIARPTKKPSAKKPIAKPTKTPAANKSIAKPAKKPIANKSIAKPTKKTAANKSIAKPAKKPVAKPTKKPSANKFIAKPTKKFIAKKPVAKPAKKSIAKKPIAKPTKKPVKKPKRPAVPAKKPTKKAREPKLLIGPRGKVKHSAKSWGIEREPKVLPPPEEVTIRGEKGKTLDRLARAKAKALYEVERKFSERLHRAKVERAKLNPLTPEDTQDLLKMLGGLRTAAEDVNTDFRAETATDFQGHAMHAKMTVSGITSSTADPLVASDQINLLIEGLIKKLRKQKIRKGLSVQLSFVPQESVYLAYGRDGDLMTTSWAYAKNKDDLEAFAPAAQRMVNAMIRNGWEITALNVMMFYDNVAAKGPKAVKPSVKRGKKAKR